MFRRLTFLALLIILVVVASIASACDKRPPDDAKPRKRGDNGYKLLIGTTPISGYQPGKVYNLFLLGQRTHEKLQQFTHFTLTAKAAKGVNRRSGTTVAGPKRVGRFQLFSDSLTKFNENCINTVSEADDFPKTEIQVLWVAPPAGSGCVALSAMIYESSGSWYSDDGELTKIVCETQPEAVVDKKNECCACDEAKYNFIFEGIWSNETHPKDFPFAIWLTHFSDVIGASHEADFSFWGENHIATDGFRSLAEFGSPRALEQELRVKGNRLRTLFKAAGLWYPNVNANTSSHFRVDRKHHKVSMVSMFGPSPDWVVGISGLNLCRPDCTWTEQEDIDLYPWDAGTDNGITYMSPNAETQPRERMTRITTMYPEDPRAPFYNPKSNSMIPLAKLYIRREKVISKSCDADFLKQILDVAENNEETVRQECQTTQWGQWSSCSVTCGKGIRSRTREYKSPRTAKRSNCDLQLISKEMCVADIPECEGDVNDEDGENLAKVALSVDEEGEGVGVCRTGPWSEWSQCSASCGIGITMRTRTFIDHQGRKKCPHISVVEKEKCMKPECSITNMEIPDPLCPTTIWSDWSPCSTTCGQGVQIRTRLLLVEPQIKRSCEARIELNQQRPCADQSECNMDPSTAETICKLAPISGPCRSEYTRYAYNPRTKTCEGFMYGGCRGNENNFLTFDHCMSTCKNVKITDIQDSIFDQEDSLPVDCVLSGWTDWTPCSVSCGIGKSEKYRHVILEAKNGGQPCPARKIFKSRKCYAPPCQ